MVIIGVSPLLIVGILIALAAILFLVLRRGR
jgi:hypothetical protein